MKNKQCIACGRPFKPRPQVPQQAYCSAPSCQRERRRQWQRLKLQNDPDYQDNQDRAQKAWVERNPNYSRQYRDSHPEYVKRNRDQQRERVALTKNPAVAKMNVSGLLPEKAFCVCWLYGVLHYFYRTQSSKESNGGNSTPNTGSFTHDVAQAEWL